MDWQGKKVLITGADGFIGSHLTERLLSLGAYVRALSQYNSFNYWGHLEEFYKDYENLDVVSGDIRDPFFCNEIAKGIEIIFHLAALIPIPYSYIAPQSYVETNISGTLNILQAGQKANVSRFIHTSTSEAYGTAIYTPIDEKHPLQAQSPYSATKISADKLAESFYRSFGLPVVIARPFNTYGPRQSARAVIPTIIIQALTSDEVKLGDLSPKRDFNYVQDTVSGFLAIADEDDFIGDVVNIGSGIAHSIEDAVKAVEKALGRKLNVVLDEKRVRPKNSEVMLLLCDASKLRKTGWQSEFDFEKGIAETIEWFKEHLSAYKSDMYNI